MRILALTTEKNVRKLGQFANKPPANPFGTSSQTSSTTPPLLLTNKPTPSMIIGYIGGFFKQNSLLFHIIAYFIFTCT